MGKGRKPNPIGLRVASETDEAERLFSVPPSTLNEHGRRHWHEIVAVLWPRGILEPVDTVALEGAAMAYGRAVECDRLVAERGPVFAGCVNPATNAAIKYWNLWRSFCSELGLSPCSRARLKLAAATPELSEFETFLRG